jgi:flagellar biosynthesis chaperone FliJ
MKNKFKPIMDFRKQEVKMQQIAISKLFADIEDTKTKILNFSHCINNMDTPINGRLSEILQNRAIIKFLRNDIDNEKNREIEYKNILLIEQEKLKDINIEYEKAKYLFEQEHKKWLEYREVKEQEELDDIGQKLYL